MNKSMFFILGIWYSYVMSLISKDNELIICLIAISFVFIILELTVYLCREEDEVLEKLEEERNEN